MVLITRRDAISRQITNKSKIIKTLLLGVASFLIPVLVIVLDPIHLIVNYNLRLKIGSLLCGILQNEIKAAHLALYLFNVTNGERFMAGLDPKLKVEEVGPFVYQEYRWFEDLQEDENRTTMSMTPKFRAEFIPEESIGHPKDVHLHLPNIPLFGATAIFSNYPGIVRYVFSTMAAQINSKAIIKVNVHDYLWGYRNPLVTLCNNLVPGLVYFDSVGLLDRLYDNQSDYRVTVGSTGPDRFKIKSVKKYRKLKNNGIEDTELSEQYFEETYEGLGYPTVLTPDTPIKFYRIGICRIFEIEFMKKKIMEYNGEGLVYTLSNRTFLNEHNPITKKRYPDGLMDISECFYNLPFVVANAHYTGSDPKLLEYVDGLKPDPEKYANEIIIDRKVGVTFNAKLSLQLSMALDDISYNRETRKFANSFVPIVRLSATQPRMSEGIMILFYLVYLVAPYCMIIIECILFMVGSILLFRTVRSIYFNSISAKKKIPKTAKDKKIVAETLSGIPLISK